MQHRSCNSSLHAGSFRHQICSIMLKYHHGEIKNSFQKPSATNDNFGLVQLNRWSEVPGKKGRWIISLLTKNPGSGGFLKNIRKKNTVQAQSCRRLTLWIPNNNLEGPECTIDSYYLKLVHHTCCDYLCHCESLNFPSGLAYSCCPSWRPGSEVFPSRRFATWCVEDLPRRKVHIIEK